MIQKIKISFREKLSEISLQNRAFSFQGSDKSTKKSEESLVRWETDEEDEKANFHSTLVHKAVV